MRKVRENILVSEGDLAVFTEGAKIFSAPVKPGGSYTVNVRPGQWVVFDGDDADPVGLGPGVTSGDVNKLVVAIGYDGAGLGYSTTLRKPFGDYLDPWGIQRVNSTCSSCGLPPIVDALFRCTTSEEAYSLEVHVFDDTTDNQYPFNVPAIYPLTVKAADLQCDGCTEAEISEKLACYFIEAINGQAAPNAKSVFGLTYPNGIFGKKFKASGLYPNSYDYCISNAGTVGCEDCINVDGIKGLDIDGETNLAFTNSLNPADNDYTLVGQLEHIIDQINVGLNGQGTAVLIENVGNCCDARIQINTCLTLNGIIDAADVTVAECALTNPLAPVAHPLNKECPTCPTASEPTYQWYGIRLYGDIPQPRCTSDDLPPNPPAGWLSSDLQVFGHEGFDGANFFVRSVQAATNPQNLGYEWKWREYVADTGGSGLDFEPYNDHFGPIGLPGAGSRALKTVTKCKKSYCSIVIDHSIHYPNQGVSPAARSAKGRTILLVPDVDTTTSTSLLAILNPFLASTTCPNKQVLACGCQDEDPEVV